MDQNQINKRYAGGYRLMGLLNFFSYLVLGIGGLILLVGLVSASEGSGVGKGVVFLSSISSFGVSLLVATGLQGCASVLRAVTDTAVVTLGGSIPELRSPQQIRPPQAPPPQAPPPQVGAVR